MNQKLSRHQSSKKLRSRHQLPRKKLSRHQLKKKEGRDIIQQSQHQRKEIEVATSAAKKGGRDIIKLSRHQLRRLEVTTSFSSCDIISKGKRVATSAAKEGRSRQHLAVATSNLRDTKDKSRQNKSFCDITETIEVATKNRCRDINNKIGQLI